MEPHEKVLGFIPWSKCLPMNAACKTFKNSLLMALLSSNNSIDINYAINTRLRNNLNEKLQQLTTHA